MSTVEPIRKLSHIKKIEEVLSDNKRDLLLFTVGINSGLRISDILSLNVADVKNKSHICIEEKKTGKQKRIAINAKLRSMFSEYTKDVSNDSPLFTTKFKNRMNRISAYTIIKEACEKIGLSDRFGTHTMRKTFGYHHYKKYHDIVMLQKLFNHSSPQITLRYVGIEQDKIDRCYRNFIL